MDTVFLTEPAKRHLSEIKGRSAYDIANAQIVERALQLLNEKEKRLVK